MSTTMPSYVQQIESQSPQPPSMHWALVLVLSIFTLGFFGFFWAFRQAIFARKIDAANPKTKLAVVEVAASLACALLAVMLSGVNAWNVMRGGPDVGLNQILHLLRLFQFLTFAFGALMVRNALVARYGIKMNQGLTMLFNVFYVQYHMSRIIALRIPLLNPAIDTNQAMPQAAPGRF